MGVVDRVIFVSAGRDIPEWSGINQFTAAEGRLENFAVAGAPVDTARTDAAAGHHAFGTVDRLRGVVGIWS
ncbi:hypothetical protein SDC9_176084 [bioreactor metagenome]|uniref:Uncharacterized protein n=1 Tax=bioreactor metagenome TaxID=1076179 RepID=A0A645GP00_9ZZZZ